MKYKCENELNTLNFRDFGVISVTFTGDKLSIMTNGGIAKYDNSCNETLEERYISETDITFYNAKIERFFLEGGKYYDAADVLIEEIPDKDFAPEEYTDKLKLFESEEATVFFVGKNSSTDIPFYEVAIDIVNDTYWLKITADKVSASFDRFMNRVIQ